MKKRRPLSHAANAVTACGRTPWSRHDDRPRRYFRFWHIVWAISAAIAAVVLAPPARAESCSKSRDYIFANSSGELPQKPKVYQDLFKSCLDTLPMSNVKDAFILKGGAIAVIPKDDGVTATTSTLAQFCGRFRGGNLRFVTRRELPEASNIARAVQLSSAGSISCRKITGS